MSSTYTWDEVRQHTSPGDLWLVIDNKVYDVSQLSLLPTPHHRGPVCCPRMEEAGMLVGEASYLIRRSCLSGEALYSVAALL